MVESITRMNNKLDAILCKKYPLIFAGRHKDMRETAMCWGFECGDGWFKIIDRLCKKLQKESYRSGYQVEAFQVKEKFGELRFYIGAGTDKHHDLTWKATNKSRHVCEKCGKPGKLHGYSWLYTACHEHTDQEDKEYDLELTGKL